MGLMDPGTAPREVRPLKSPHLNWRRLLRLSPPPPARSRPRALNSHTPSSSAARRRPRRLLPLPCAQVVFRHPTLIDAVPLARLVVDDRRRLGRDGGGASCAVTRRCGGGGGGGGGGTLLARGGRGRRRGEVGGVADVADAGEDRAEKGVQEQAARRGGEGSQSKASVSVREGRSDGSGDVQLEVEPGRLRLADRDSRVVSKHRVRVVALRSKKVALRFGQPRGTPPNNTRAKRTASL